MNHMSSSPTSYGFLTLIFKPLYIVIYIFSIIKLKIDRIKLLIVKSIYRQRFHN